MAVLLSDCSSGFDYVLTRTSKSYANNNNRFAYEKKIERNMHHLQQWFRASFELSQGFLNKK